MKGDEAAGCDHHVTKPCSPLQFLRTICGVLGEHASGSCSPLYGSALLLNALAKPASEMVTFGRSASNEVATASAVPAIVDWIDAQALVVGPAQLETLMMDAAGR